MAGTARTRYAATRGLAALLLFAVAGSAIARDLPATPVERIAAQAVACDDFNGNVLVARHGRILFQRSYGPADAARSRPLDPDTRFNIGSITKEFSGAALLQLRQQGRVSLDAPVRTYLPELGSWADTVTVAHTLDYTSGMPAMAWQDIRGDADIQRGIRAITTLETPPGTAYDYNNHNVFLRHMLIERITGMGYKAYVERNLFRPCGMTRSAITPLNPDIPIAIGFKAGAIADKAELPITGGGYVTARDLLRWSQCLARGRLLDPASLRALGHRFADDAQSPLGKATFVDGRMVRHVHDGRSGSFEALLVADARSGLTIVLLGNSHRGKLYDIAATIETALRGK